MDGKVENLELEKIVPDIIDKRPDGKITVTYPSGVSVNYGNELTPRSVKDKPKFGFPSDSNKLYTLSMIDPDAPSRLDNHLAPILHYLVINIPGNDVSKGQTLADYRGSGPPEHTGLHRYIFLLYEQTVGKITNETMNISSESRDGRLKFDYKAWARKYNLGAPVAVNFYVAQFDDYVAELRAKMNTPKLKPGSPENLVIDSVVPDVIDAPPKYKVEVKYKSGVMAEYGNELTPTEVKEPPLVTYPAWVGQYYTLVMVDPDAPSRKERRSTQFMHYMVINIPGRNVTEGQVVYPYVGSGPPKDSGLHRYIWLVYRQSLGQKMNVDLIDDVEHRFKFSMKSFAKEFKLGDPIAANYYQAQYDKHVDVLMAEFRSKYMKT